MKFNAKTPATLKFTLPLKADGTIAGNEETATSTKQFAWNIIEPKAIVDPNYVGYEWNGINYFLDQFIDTIFEVSHDEYSTKITIDFETVEGE